MAGVEEIAKKTGGTEAGVAGVLVEGGTGLLSFSADLLLFASGKSSLWG